MLTYSYHGHGYDEGQGIRTPWLFILTVAFREITNLRKQMVFADSLNKTSENENQRTYEKNE